MFNKYLFSPYAVVHYKQYYRLFTHAFLHVDYIHLAFNMFALYVFGADLLEKEFFYLFGEKAILYYILLYVGGIIFSSVFELIRQKNNPSYSSVGASGAVNSVVFSAILLNPTMGMGFLFIPIPIPAWLFGLIFLGYSWYMAKKGTDNIGHNAHFFGALFGFGFTWLLKTDALLLFFERIFLNV
jgi:membrane associated rhomboid family serine protease